MTEDETRALCRTYLAYRTLGAETIPGPGCLAVRQDLAPLIHDVNHLQVSDYDELDVPAALSFLEETFSEPHFHHRQVLTTPFSQPALEAQLAHAGWKPDPTLQGLLKRELQGPAPPKFDLRRVEGEGDWSLLDRLVRADHLEVDAKRGTRIYSPEVTRQIQAVRRRAAEEIHFFMAWVDGSPVAFFSSWPGQDGVGMVEDLFTLPSHRRRGIARALIHHCVGDARARGAAAVLIGSDPDDTPKEIYAAMGFEPTCLTKNWLKRISDADVFDSD